jgi:hypothetical protein
MPTSIPPTTPPHPDDTLDPITGEPGSHPVGAGLGAAGGATAGAALGAMVGPVGSVVGAAVGGLIGGLTGKGFAEGLDPTAEDAYWRAEHPNQPYAAGRPYEDFAPAYRVGYTTYRPDANLDAKLEDLRRAYEQSRGESQIDWEDARPAAERAWRRAERLRTEAADPHRTIS